MEFTNVTPNVCVFCYKSCPPESFNTQHTAKVNTFFANLSRFLNSSNSSVKQTFKSTSLFPNCKDCEILTTNFSDVYHQIKCLELHLIWKLETLRKVMQSADKVPSRVAHMKQCFGKEGNDNETSSNNTNLNSKLKAFKLFRSDIKKKCDTKRSLSTRQPHVILKKFDENVKVPCSQIMTRSLQTYTPSALLKEEEVLDLTVIREWSISFAFVLYLLTSPSNATRRTSDCNILICIDPSTDEGSDEVVLDGETTHESSTSKIENIAEDTFSECLSVDNNYQEPATEQDQMSIDSQPLNTSISLPEENIKQELYCNEDFDECAKELEDHFPDSCCSSHVSKNMETSDKSVDMSDRGQETERRGTTSSGNYENSKCTDGNVEPCSFGHGKESSSNSISTGEMECDDNNWNPDSNIPTWSCEILNCLKMFETKDDLAKHQMFDIHQESVNTSVVPPEETFICKICDATYKLIDEFLSHVKSHKTAESAERCWKCKQCGKEFKRRETFKRHVVFHKNPADWKCGCPICVQKCFGTKDLKENHKVLSKYKPIEPKPNDKPWVCKYCGENFAVRVQWLKHALTKHR